MRGWFSAVCRLLLAFPARKTPRYRAATSCEHTEGTLLVAVFNLDSFAQHHEEAMKNLFGFNPRKWFPLIDFITVK